MRDKSTSGGALSGATHLTFVFPMPENIANARLHWAVKDLKRRAFFDTCDALQAAKRLPAPPPAPWEFSLAHVTMFLAGHMDDDNAGNRNKWIWDWLKTRGYIANDSRRHLRQTGYPSQVVKRDGNYRVEVRLTRLTVMEKQSA
jgi:hypothetical protein